MSEDWNDIGSSRAAELLGERLRNHRITQGFKQTELADKAKVSRDALSRLETGKGGRMETFLRVLRALGLADRIECAIDDPADRPTERYKRPEPRRRLRRSSREERGKVDKPAAFVWPENR